MKFFEELKKDKSVGFWFTLGLIVLSIITAIVYISCFNGTDEMNYVAFSFLLIGAVLSTVCVVFKKYTIASYVIGGTIFLSLLFYVYAVYYYVSVVMVGIDLDHFSTEFIVTTILFAVGTICGISNVFIPQTKKVIEETTVESEEK